MTKLPCWESFRGSFETVEEKMIWRRSIYLTPEEWNQVEKMLINSLTELSHYAILLARELQEDLKNEEK